MSHELGESHLSLIYRHKTQRYKSQEPPTTNHQPPLYVAMEKSNELHLI